MGVSILLVAVGAILTFAVTVNTNDSGVNLHTIGVILMAVGVLGLVVSMMFWSSWGGFGGRRAVTSERTITTRED